MKHLKTKKQLNEESENLNISDVSISKNHFIEEFNKLKQSYNKPWVDIDELKSLYTYGEIQKFVKLGWIESDGAEYDMARPSFKLK